jgi:hypothetical protein
VKCRANSSRQPRSRRLMEQSPVKRIALPAEDRLQKPWWLDQDSAGIRNRIRRKGA